MKMRIEITSFEDSIFMQSSQTLGTSHTCEGLSQKVARMADSYSCEFKYITLV